MIPELVRYIEDAKRQGYAIDEIRHHLTNHGWNDYLIDYALQQVERRNDRRWLQGSVMAIFFIMLASAGTVWWYTPPSDPGSVQPLCILEAPSGSTTLLTDISSCCSRIPHNACVRVPNPAQLRTMHGRIIFSPTVSCTLPQGRILTSSETIQQCTSFLKP